jgi:hypothetical protein
MPVLSLNSDGIDITVLTFPHEWSAALTITHRLPAIVTTGLSGREGRRPDAEDLRHIAAVHLVLTGDEAQACRQMLATISDEWVGLPLWVDARTGADWAGRIYDAQRLIDLTAGAIVAHDAVLDAAHLYAPLLVGHFEGQLPPLPADSDQQVDLSFTIFEDSPWTFRIGIAGAAGVAGTFPADLAPDWTGPTEQQPQYGLEFGSIGEVRERTIEGQERAFVWAQSAGLTLTRSQTRELLAFFVASESMRKKFTCPLWFHPSVATAEAPASTKVRFASDTLTIGYDSADVAQCKVALIQVPWEIEGVEGEEPEQAPRVFLYKYTYSLPVPQIYRFTNWARPLARTADGTYAPAPMKHRQTSEGLDGLGNSLSIDSFNFTGNPLQLWRPDVIEAPLLLVVYEAESWPIDPDTAIVIWSGEIKRPSYDGARIEAPGLFLRGFLDRQIPRVLASRKCQVELFSTPCGLVRAALAVAGTFTSAAGCVLDIATAAADPDNTYVYGTIEIGAGATWEQRGIIASEVIGGGQRITVDWPVRQAAAGQVVSIARGCNRDWDTCGDLANQKRFRGIPNLPNVNLALPSMALPSAPAKK